jgi:Asp-tRNA(Asn)/Glu-tRNA(Gln) amidotransferase A subunit family amidase
VIVHRRLDCVKVRRAHAFIGHNVPTTIFLVDTAYYPIVNFRMASMTDLCQLPAFELVRHPSEELAEFLKQAREVDFSLSEARRRLVAIDEYRIQMLTFMADYDVIVCPAMPTAAKPHHHGLVEINDFSHMMVHNLTGWPAAVVRCGTSSEGLPIGVQIVARPWQDATALAVARHLEKVFGGWQPPPMVAA